MKLRQSRKNRKNQRKMTRRRQRGGATMKISSAIDKLQEIKKKYGDLDFYKVVYEYGDSNIEDVIEIYHSDQGGVNRAMLE